MNSPEQQGPPDPHAATRCRAVSEAESLRALIDAVAGAVDEPAVDALRTCLEQALVRLTGLDRVRVRPGPAQVKGPRPLMVREGLCIDIPRPGGTAGVLQVAPPAGRPLTPEQRRILADGAKVAALVYEIERWRGGGAAALSPVRSAATGLLGSSAVMERLRERIDRIARTDFAVLIEGESGVGKELVARSIHEQSRRSRGPFVAVNCAALVETLLEAELFGIEDRTATGVRGRRGKFEAADGGTLFLDEVSDLSASAQAKLLRVLQELAVERVGGQVAQRVDTRVIAATNRGLLQLVEQGRFRLDLYYRLNALEIRVPSLRGRREDIFELVEHFLKQHRGVRHLGVTAEAMDALMSYEWPGNVRELERVIERAVTLAETEEIDLGDLPPAITRRYAEALLPSIAADDSMRAFGSRYARLVLRRCGNNKRKACRVLQISYHTLQAYLQYSLKHPADDAVVEPPSTAPECHDEGAGEEDSDE